ncbi:glycosyltransferase [Altererythrobacter fulvus]|uniref:glycosyltransferase n=1 Tax=Caenibius fulvus TaxID=2126012 RepID=UPI003019824E
MKILHYTHSLTRSAGGVFFAVTGLAKAMQALGHEVSAIGWADEHFEEDRALWGEVRLLPRHSGNPGYGFAPQMLARILQEKPDILHVQGIWSAASIYGRMAAARGIQVVCSPHGMLEPYILARRPAVKSVHAALFERPMLRTGHVHALNAKERDAVLAFMPSLAGRIFVAPNGVEQAVAPEPDAARAGTLFLGRLHPKKQVLELMRSWRAAPALAQEQLTIAGWGDADYTAEVRALAEAAPNIHFAGPLFGEAKDKALREARHFILPSLSEGLPMAVLEAIQLGCIPVLTDDCNLPELFSDGIALRMATDFSDFEIVMSDAVARPEEEAQRMSMAAAAYSNRYLWSNIAATMAGEYRQILSGRT